jgi:hypothetical protein
MNDTIKKTDTGRSAGKRKGMKHGTELLCKTHGPEGLIIQEREPSSKHRFEIKCRLCGGRYKNWASARQVEQLLRIYPGCDARDYNASAWNALFEDAD